MFFCPSWCDSGIIFTSDLWIALPNCFPRDKMVFTVTIHNFIYLTCTIVCLMMTRLLASARFQRPWYLPISKEYSISQFQLNDMISSILADFMIKWQQVVSISCCPRWSVYDDGRSNYMCVYLNLSTLDETVHLIHCCSRDYLLAWFNFNPSMDKLSHTQ